MKWKKIKANVFWGEIAPLKHIVQFYEDDRSFLDVLTGFAGAGINAGDSVIIIATTEHLEELERRLIAHGIYLPSLLSENQYIPVNADELLAKFMVDGMPDPTCFEKELKILLHRAGKRQRKIRAFGEMVALLMAEGNQPATIALESLWNKVCQREMLSLFCAYPKSVIEGKSEVMHSLCGCHSEVITVSHPYGDIIYRNARSTGITDRKNQFIA